jgi:hypothetical protein
METTLNPSTHSGEIQTVLGVIQGQTWGRAAVVVPGQWCHARFPDPSQGHEWVLNATNMGYEAIFSSWLGLTIISATHKSHLGSINFQNRQFGAEQ